MNRVYYHRYPICPNCYEPVHPDDVENLRNGGFQKCQKCGFEFRATLNLVDDRDIFKDFAETFKKKYPKSTDDQLRHLPLFWKVKLNEIENTYMESLRGLVPGKYLITWPWRRVKFSTVLVSEYLLDYQNSRGLLVGRKAGGSDWYREPDPINVIKNLTYLESRGDLMKRNAENLEVPKFSKNYLFKTRKVCHAAVKLKGISSQPKEYVCYDEGPTECKKKILKELEEDYGYREDQIRSLVIGHKEKIPNPSGTAFIDIEIKCKEERGSTLKLNYDRRDLTGVLSNIEKLKRVNFSDRLTVLAGPKDIGEVIQQISSKKPDIVIIEDIDSFVEPANLRNAENVVRNLISASGEATLLFFSTHRNKRYVYGLDLKYEAWIRKYGIVPHTWDSDPVFRKMKGDYLQENIASNGWIPPVKKVNRVNVTTVEVRELVPILKMMETVSRSVSDEDTSDYVNYLRWLKRSLLYLKHPDVNLTYRYRITNRNEHQDRIEYNFDKFLDHCNDLYGYGKISEEERKGIRTELLRIYSGNNSEPINPLRNRIIEWIKSLKEKDDKSVVYLVANPYEREPLENILKNSEVGSLIENFLRISDWRRIALYSRLVSHEKKKYLVFSYIPSYIDLNEIDFDEIVLFGCKADLEIFGRAIEKGLTDIYSRPVYVPDKNEKMPLELREIVEELVEDNGKLPDIKEELSEPIQMEEVKPDEARSSHYLEPGEHALLLFDNGNNGILVPYNSSILIKGVRGIEEIEIDSSYSDRLMDKLSGSLLFTSVSGSFKSVFAELMIRKAGDIKFTRSGFKWDGFIDLLKCSTSWNNLMANYVERGGEETKKMEEELAVTLSKMDLAAKNPNYIKFWWQRYREIGNGIRIYDIERPRRFKDVEKIIQEMKELEPAATQDTCDPERIFEGSLHIQEIRRSLLKHDYYDLPDNLKGIIGDLEDDMDEIIEKSSKFKFERVADTVIIDKVYPFKVMEMAEIEKYCRIDPSR
jgi:hypothetical protein